jgi:hypothetical protein
VKHLVRWFIDQTKTGDCYICFFLFVNYRNHLIRFQQYQLVEQATRMAIIANVVHHNIEESLKLCGFASYVVFDEGIPKTFEYVNKQLN